MEVLWVISGAVVTVGIVGYFLVLLLEFLFHQKPDNKMITECWHCGGYLIAEKDKGWKSAKCSKCGATGEKNLRYYTRE